MRLARSDSCKRLWVSELSASHTTGKASASTLAITGSSMLCGKRPRTRLTLSRTSAAAASGSRSSLKRTVIWLDSWRLTEVIMSTPSMPASESSSGLVIWASTTSLDAPASRVLTLTLGSSMRGYSRTLRPRNETQPTSKISSESTVANTGRRMAVWGNCISGPRALPSPPPAPGCRLGPPFASAAAQPPPPPPRRRASRATPALGRCGAGPTGLPPGGPRHPPR